MENETKNYKFPKPGEDDFYDINEYNRTLDSIDEELMNLEQKKLDTTGDSSQTVTAFEEEVLRENLESGETLSLTHGKIKKWFSEMKDIAFSGRASDIETDGANRFVSDGEKKNWNSKVSAEGDISDTKIQSLDSVSSEFPIPEEGETSRQFFGKVRKFIQDFNNFKTGIITVGKLVNNGSTTAGGYALDARYGKTLFDLYNRLNNNLAKDYSIESLGLDSSTVTRQNLIDKFHSIFGNTPNSVMNVYARINGTNPDMPKGKSYGTLTGKIFCDGNTTRAEFTWYADTSISNQMYTSRYASSASIPVSVWTNTSNDDIIATQNTSFTITSTTTVGDIYNMVHSENVMLPIICCTQGIYPSWGRAMIMYCNKNNNGAVFRIMVSDDDSATTGFFYGWDTPLTTLIGSLPLHILTTTVRNP